MAKKNEIIVKDVVKNWMCQKNTLVYLGLWEKLNNPIFKGIEFDPLLSETKKVTPSRSAGCRRVLLSFNSHT